MTWRMGVAVACVGDDEGAYVLNLDDLELQQSPFHLNGSAGFVFNAIVEGAVSEAELVERVRQKFDIPAEVDVAAAVNTCLEQLAARRLIERAD